MQRRKNLIASIWILRKKAWCKYLCAWSVIVLHRVHNHLIRMSCTDTRHTICCRQDAIPRYNAIYATQQECQDACTNQVVGCNAINYAPADVGKRYVLFGSKWEDAQPAPTDMYTHTHARMHMQGKEGPMRIFILWPGLQILQGETFQCLDIQWTAVKIRWLEASWYDESRWIGLHEAQWRVWTTLYYV